MHFVRACVIIVILTFSFFQSKRIKKKIVKVIEDEIYSKHFEICKETEKFVLVKFVEDIQFSESHFF